MAKNQQYFSSFCNCRYYRHALTLGLIAIFLQGCMPATVRYQPVPPSRLSEEPSKKFIVAAPASWLNTGVIVDRGELINIRTHGSWKASPFCNETGAEGLKSEYLLCMKGLIESTFPVPEAPIGSLVAKIGTNGKPFLVGMAPQITAPDSGPLHLMMNDPEGLLGDNTGEIEVYISSQTSDSGENNSAKAYKTKRVSEHDAKICASRENPQAIITSCTALIEDGQLYGRDLGIAYGRRARAFEKLNQFEKSIVDYEQVARNIPDDPHAYNSIAWIRATSFDPNIRSGTQALKYANKAISMKNLAVFRDTLAAAYAELGQFENAMSNEEQAIALTHQSLSARPDGKDYYLERIRRFEARLELYRKKVPYRSTSSH